MTSAALGSILAAMGSWTLRPDLRSLDDIQVLVVGSGAAGSSAAIAAARAGASVLLVEREGTLGGTSTAVLDTFYGFFTPGPNPRRVVGGLGQEVTRRLALQGAAFERPNTYGAGTGVTYNPEVLRVLWDELCEAAGVVVLLHAAVVDVQARDRRITRVLLASGSELIDVHPEVVIDASGEGVVAHLAGARSEGYAETPGAQAMTVTFTMAPVAMGTWGAVSRSEFLAAVAVAREDGYALPRADGSIHNTTVDGVQFVHMARVGGRDPRDPFQLSTAEREGRAQAVEYARFLRNRVPGFEDASIVWMARRTGIRESRRIVGRYWLERNDVLNHHRFEDDIALGAAPIEVHSTEGATRWEFLPEGGLYGIPYRCLLPADLDWLLIAGRCLSASHDAHATARNMAQCTAMGQAAGTAAALAAASGIPPHAIDPSALRVSLIRDGALLAEAVPA